MNITYLSMKDDGLDVGAAGGEKPFERRKKNTETDKKCKQKEKKNTRTRKREKKKEKMSTKCILRD